MSNEELLQTKTEEKIRLVEEVPPPPPENVEIKSQVPQIKPADASNGKGSTGTAPKIAKLSDTASNDADKLRTKDDAQKLLQELPTDEFLNFLEQSSPEQLESFLNHLAPSKQPVAQPLRSLFSSLVSIPDEPRGNFSIIGWWEARRMLFNMVILLCGLPTVLIIYLTGLASLKFTVTGSIEYAILANICYTAGWICELIARSWWQERARHLGPILFTLGFAFSILLTIGAGVIMILLFGLLFMARGF